MSVYLRAKFEVSSIILTSFRQDGKGWGRGGGGVILPPPPPPPQSKPLKSPLRIGLNTVTEEIIHIP